MTIGFKFKPALSSMLAVLGLNLFALPVIAKVDDADLKAVYLFRFALLADWQNTGVSSEHIEYCVTDINEISLRLEAIIASKPQMARFFLLSEGGDPQVCHILFTSQSDADNNEQLRQQYPHALLVGDGVDFVKNGGMIAFVKVRNRIRPLIARANVEQSQVLLRSQLLEVSELYKAEAE
ncbi:YfiR family protein [Vibrio rhodolitus]|uniref:YfiR family protein n=1 Tax=Vibrio rhodolitus TaxID=2231649 RepID=UPI001FC9E291|nr:YfiR family protein [Vibrio rhodolitus]